MMTDLARGVWELKKWGGHGTVAVSHNQGNRRRGNFNSMSGVRVHMQDLRG